MITKTSTFSKKSFNFHVDGSPIPRRGGQDCRGGKGKNIRSPTATTDEELNMHLTNWLISTGKIQSQEEHSHFLNQQANSTSR